MIQRFEVTYQDPGSRARVGRLVTRRGVVETPAFMPVGTQAAVKTLTPDEVRDTGAQIVLANTYHLMLRPGVEIIRDAGSVHHFMGWDGPILTDSGGFQVFSLARRRTVREEGVEFRSHIDGRKVQLSPESVIDLQLSFGSDIMMPLDELTAYSDSDADQASAAERTQRWLARSVQHFGLKVDSDEKSRPMIFGITQGGFDAERRVEHARRTAEQPVDGFSIGGLSVGESKSELHDMLDASVSPLPRDRPRYLMGVGSPEDLWNAVSLGVDMFDCVHATRIARRGALFTKSGRVNITNSRFRSMFEPLDSDCSCLSCQTFSAAYLHHLFRAGEMLGPRLATIHNLHAVQQTMKTIRCSISAGRFSQEHRRFLSEYRTVDEAVANSQRTRWLNARTTDANR